MTVNHMMTATVLVLCGWLVSPLAGQTAASEKVVVWEIRGDAMREVTYIKVNGIWREQHDNRPTEPAEAEAEPAPPDDTVPPLVPAPPTANQKKLPTSVGYGSRQPWKYTPRKSFRYQKKTDWKYTPRKDWSYRANKNQTYTPKSNWKYTPKSKRFGSRRYIPRSR